MIDNSVVRHACRCGHDWGFHDLSYNGPTPTSLCSEKSCRCARFKWWYSLRICRERLAGLAKALPNV